MSTEQKSKSFTLQMAKTAFARVRHQEEHRDKDVDAHLMEDFARLLVNCINRTIEAFEKQGVRVPGLKRNNYIDRYSRQHNTKPGYYYHDKDGNIHNITAEQAFLAMCHEEAELRRQQQKDATLQRIESAKMSEFDKLCARTQAEFDALPDE